MSVSDDLAQSLSGLAKRVRRLEKFHFASSAEIDSQIYARARADSIAMKLALPQLRGFWPFSSTNDVRTIIDQAGAGRHLQAVGSPTFSSTENNAPYGMTSGSGQAWVRATENGLNVVGALTFGLWFYTNDLTSNKYVMSKWTTSGDQRGWYMTVVPTSGLITFAGSSDGITQEIALVNFDSPVVVGGWTFAVARFIESVSASLFVNNISSIFTTSIPSTLFSNTAALMINGVNGGNYLTNGGFAQAFLCAAALSDQVIEDMFENDRVLFGV